MDDDDLHSVTGEADNGEVEDYLVDPAVSRLPPRQPSSVVGGFLIPVNQLAILVPYLALVLLVGVLSTIFTIRRRREF